MKTSKETLCETCRHDKKHDCEYACTGVTGWDEVNEIVTACEDYEEDNK